MNLDATGKESTKASGSSKSSQKTKKSAPQSKHGSERDHESTTSKKGPRGKKAPDIRLDKEQHEITDDRGQASSQTGTHKSPSKGPNARLPGNHSASRNQEEPRLSHIPTAERRFDPASRTEPPGVPDIESAKVPPSTESQAQPPKASRDIGADHRNINGDVIVAAPKDVETSDAEPKYMARTIQKMTRVQLGADIEDIERELKPMCPAEQPKARSQTADTQPAVQRPEDRTKPSGGDIRSPEVSHWRKYVQYCVGISIVLLATIVTVLSALRHRPQERHYDTCATPACDAYSKRLRESINSSVNPCDSFTHYVCDGWTSRYEISVNNDALLFSLARMSQIVRDIEVPKSGQNMMQRAAAFYRSCERVGKGDSNQLRDVLLALKTANVVWPFRANHPNFLQTLLHLSIKLRCPSILTFNILSTSSKTYLIQGPSNEFFMLYRRANEQLRSPGGRQRYFDKLKKTFAAASGPEKLNDLVTFQETRKAEEKILDVLWKWSDMHRLMNIEKQINFFIGEFKAKKWKEALADYGLGTPNITNSELLTDSYAFLLTFFGLWRKYGDEEMHLLLSWCAVQVAALFTNQELLVNFYGTHQKVELGHAAFCFSKTFVATGDALLYRFSETTLPANHRREARALILDVRQSLQRQILSWEHRDDNVTVVHDWDSTSVVLQYFERPVGKDHEGKSDANDVPDEGAVDMGDSLVANWLLAPNASFLNPSSRHLAKVMQDLGLYLVHMDTLQPDFSLLPYAFGFPYYDHGATPALNYAGIGSRVAEALSLLFTTVYILSERARIAIKAHDHCMANASFSENDAFGVPGSGFYSLSVKFIHLPPTLAIPMSALQQPKKKSQAWLLTGTLTNCHPVDTGCRQKAGFKVDHSKRAQYFEPISLKTALYAYRARKNIKDQRLSGLEFLTPEQLFFIAACYVRCVRTSGPPGVTHDLCDAQFRQIAEFADAFGCAIDSHMNPSQRCTLF